MSDKRYYITTPLYYVNDQPHIGHAYTTIAADCLARFMRQDGRDVYFMTGTDEHGQKVEAAAEKAGMGTKEFVDQVVCTFRELWDEYEISYDHFIRTTDASHIKSVQDFFQVLYDKGHIYKGQYEGWYCTPCETFWTETQLQDGACPDCQREVRRLSEDTYFFRLSAFGDRLIDYIEQHPQAILPQSRRNEVLGFIRQGLIDLSITRTSFAWGVPAPFDSGHVIYVWFDALLNYITGAGYQDPEGRFAETWPADVHFIGKDILKFHGVIWPAMLMAADIEPPRSVFAHGWWTAAGVKMSKSKGNFIRPRELTDEFGLDAFRYFILREVPFGSDGDFSHKNFIHRINADLANDIGNLLNRSLAMLRKYYASEVPLPAPEYNDEVDERIIELAGVTYSRVLEQMESFSFSLAIEALWKLVSAANKFIEQKAPFTLAKDPERRAELGNVMYNLLETIRIANVLAFPFIPGIAAKMYAQLGFSDQAPPAPLCEQATWGLLSAGQKTAPGTPVFPRIEVLEAE